MTKMPGRKSNNNPRVTLCYKNGARAPGFSVPNRDWDTYFNYENKAFDEAVTIGRQFITND